MEPPEGYLEYEDEFTKKENERIKNITQSYKDKTYELSIEDALPILKDLEGLGFAPTTDVGWIAFAKAFIRIVGTKEKGEFLAERIINSCKKFPKPIEMRWIYNHFYSPADGINPRDIDDSDELKLPGTKSDDEG